MIEIFVSSQSAGFFALWRFPGSLEDLRGRWPQLAAVHRALRHADEPLPPDAGCGSLEFLVGESIGALESYKADADASMRMERDAVLVSPKSGEPFTLSLPAGDPAPPLPAEQATSAKERAVPAAAVAAVAAVLAALLGLLWVCEDCARYLAQIARALR